MDLPTGNLLLRWLRFGLIRLVKCALLCLFLLLPLFLLAPLLRLCFLEDHLLVLIARDLLFLQDLLHTFKFLYQCFPLLLLSFRLWIRLCCVLLDLLRIVDTGIFFRGGHT